MLSSATLQLTVVFDDRLTSETTIGDAVEAAAYLHGVRDAACTIVGDKSTWPGCSDQGDDAVTPCGNLAELIVRVFDDRFFACRSCAGHGEQIDPLASQHEFRYDQADRTVTWTEGDQTSTAAVRIEGGPHRPYATADWPQ
jgi:YD repeat-containing protein